MIGGRELPKQVYVYQNAAGAVPSPFDAWLVLRGVKTLDVRIGRHSQNAQHLAEWLMRPPAIEQVYYPGLAGHPGHDIARRQMHSFGGIISVRVRGGKEAALRMLTRTRLFTLPKAWGASNR